MALKFFAVDGFTYTISNALVVCTIAVVGVPSIKNKAVTKGICKDQFQLSVTNVTVPSAGATIPATGPFTATFSKTSVKNKEGSNFFLRQDDETNTINAVPQIPGTPPVAYPVSFKFTITNAGQSKVRGE